MKYLRIVILVLVALALVVFALANRSLAPVALLPPDLAAFAGFGAGIALPVWVIALGGVVLGLVLGFIWEWLREHRHRAAASTGRREVKRLERELAVMKDATGQPEDEIMALVNQTKPR